ncbi:GntR family transcriptional regulator [Streptomyces sp. NPDC093598]|uniref:GntR family transcriptional regulator n=1 Tax=Streptomyces sp. NPDC093598 TaxID=3366046 RepID=UPI00382F711E
MAGKKRDSSIGYEAIADELRAKIDSGELAPGDRVPGEKELITTYGVSRDTAWKALQVLRDQGLTESRQGAPTKVRQFERIVRPANRRLSRQIWGEGKSMWSVDVVDKQPTALDIEVERVELDARVARLLGAGEGEPAWRRSRRYAIGPKPVMRAVSHIPADLADGTSIAEEDTGPGGTYARLADVGHAPTVFREEVKSRMPTKAEKEWLDIQRGTPVIEIVRYAADESGRIVEVNEMVLDSSSYVLEYVIPS